MAQQARAVQTKQEILMAAAEVFAQRGYAAATMAEILKLAGLTKGAVYFHFASKEDLAQAVVSAQSPWLSQLDLSAPGFQPVIDMTTAYAVALLHDPIIRAAVRLVIEHGAFDKPNIEAWQATTELARTLVEQAQDTGDLLPGLQPLAVAEMVTASFAGIQLTSQVLTGRADLLERVANWWQLLLPGLVPADRIAALEPGGSPKAVAHLGEMLPGFTLPPFPAPHQA